MNHLERLTRQYYYWKGYLVKGNVKVGRLVRGGWAGELDIVTYHPQPNHLVHVESSLDADPWEKRTQRFEKKYKSGRKYIFTDVFPWLESEKTPMEQIALLITSSRKELFGAKIISIDEFVRQVKADIKTLGIMAKNAIPEEYDLLRTIQLSISGYYKLL